MEIDDIIYALPFILIAAMIYCTIKFPPEPLPPGQQYGYPDQDKLMFERDASTILVGKWSVPNNGPVVIEEEE